MDAERIIQHLANLAKGVCTITEESILKLENEEDQMIELGILTLFEEIQHAKHKLEKSNREKEILLQEIHHRVKNNLQIITSLLMLQGEYCNDEFTRSLLRQSQSRLRTMSMIHEKLYQSTDLANIDYKNYLEELVNYLKKAYADQEVHIEFEVPSFRLNLDQAIPLGLLLNEILTNAFKYGRDETGKTHIYLRIDEKESGSFIIETGDYGPGFPDKVFDSGTNSLGIQLIRDLVTQLNGKIDKLPVDQGTHYHIRFKVPEA